MRSAMNTHSELEENCWEISMENDDLLLHNPFADRIPTPTPDGSSGNPLQELQASMAESWSALDELQGRISRNQIALDAQCRLNGISSADVERFFSGNENEHEHEHDDDAGLSTSIRRMEPKVREAMRARVLGRVPLASAEATRVAKRVHQLGWDQAAEVGRMIFEERWEAAAAAAAAAASAASADSSSSSSSSSPRGVDLASLGSNNRRRRRSHEEEEFEKEGSAFYADLVAVGKKRQKTEDKSTAHSDDDDDGDDDIKVRYSRPPNGCSISRCSLRQRRQQKRPA
jgi:hypothetical protein